MPVDRRLTLECLKIPDEKLLKVAL